MIFDYTSTSGLIGQHDARVLCLQSDSLILRGRCKDSRALKWAAKRRVIIARLQSDASDCIYFDFSTCLQEKLLHHFRISSQGYCGTIWTANRRSEVVDLPTEGPKLWTYQQRPVAYIERALFQRKPLYPMVKSSQRKV